MLDITVCDMLTLYSNPEPIPKNLKKLENIIPIIPKGYKYKTKGNGSFFVMSGTYRGTVTGRQQGVNINGTPNKDDWYEYVITSDGKVHIGDFDSWDYTDAFFGISVGNILIDNGVDCFYKSKGGYALSHSANLRFIGQRTDGKFIEGVGTRYTLGTLRTAIKKLHSLVNLAILDGGGSACKETADGKKILTTSRELPNIVISLDFEGEDMQTKRVICKKGSLKNGEYPTRASKTSSYDTKHNLKIGDEIIFDEGYSANNKNNDCLLRIAGGSRADLVGRWFAYDNDYFE